MPRKEAERQASKGVPPAPWLGWVSEQPKGGGGAGIVGNSYAAAACALTLSCCQPHVLSLWLPSLVW